MKNPNRNTILPIELNNIDGPLVCIVGSGLAGLITAINLAESDNNLNIVIIDKPRRESNTQISGMRIRARQAGSNAYTDAERSAEITRLLQERNKGILSPQMSIFSQILTSEINRWNLGLSAINANLVTDRPEWFGPQWGYLGSNLKGGRGLNILNELFKIAHIDNISFITGEVTRLKRDKQSISALELSSDNGNYELRPDSIVLANGSATGELFESTNKAIRNSAASLLFDAQLPLTGASLNMWHPFGRMKKDGSPALGCMETDELAGYHFSYPDGSSDEEINRWLKTHQAHYHFDEIAKRVMQKGGRVILRNDEDRIIEAGVVLHYNHLGAQTTDGTQVPGTSNLYAVGDAASLTYWTDGNNRFPGFALGSCLVTARLAAENIRRQEPIHYEENAPRAIYREGIRQPRNSNPQELRRANTKHLKDLEFTAKTAEEKARILRDWEENIRQIDHPAQELTSGIIQALRRVHLDGEREPLAVSREGTKSNPENRSLNVEAGYSPFAHLRAYKK